MNSSVSTESFLSQASAKDYFLLLKPRVMSLVVFTGAVGYLIAPQNLHPVLGIIAIFALAMGAGAAGAMNMYYERELDAKMVRTQNRPLPMGKMHPSDALSFAIICASASVLLMWLSAGLLPAAILVFSIFFYAVIYTMLLKPSTPQNIVIGGAAGAFPPIIGWAAASGSISLDSVALFAIIFFWTPPHFWALALFSKNDYAEVGLPMLPNTHGVLSTKRHILAYTIVLFPIGLLPFVLGTSGWVYFVIAFGLGVMFCFMAFQLWRAEDSKPSRRLFGFSIIYLFALFGALLLDRLVTLVLG